jgi:hypothetical protein
MVNGKPPIGYILQDGLAVKDPESWDKVKSAWDLMATGNKSLREIASLMNSWGLNTIHSKKAYPLRAQTVQRIFRMKFYAGYLTSNIYKEEIKGKTVVCIISGGNNDILRYPEILERSLVYQGLKHYFIIEFAQKPGQLKTFLDHGLGANDDIVRFEYVKKTNKEKGPALVGIELKKKEDLQPLLDRLDKIGIKYHHIKHDDLLYDHLI